MRHLRGPATVAATTALAVIATGALATTDSSNDDLWKLSDVEAEAVPVEDRLFEGGLGSGDTTDHGDSEASESSSDSRASKQSKASKASKESKDSPD